MLEVTSRKPAPSFLRKVYAMVVRAQLEVVEALTDDLAVENATGGARLQAMHDGRFFRRTPLNRPEELHQIGHLPIWHRHRRHPLLRRPIMDELRQAAVVARGEPGRDRRTHLAAVAVGAVTPGTVGFERLLPGLCCLGDQPRSQYEHADAHHELRSFRTV